MERKKTLISFIGFMIILYGLSYFVFHQGIPCLFHKVTGFYCPGCGISRMLLSLLSFDFYQAFRFNPLLFILLCITPFYFLIVTFYTKKKGVKYKTPNAVYIFLIIVLIAFGILRNLEAFSYLAPTIVK